jgi:hypothetical protein
VSSAARRRINLLRSFTPHEAAACLITVLERRAATFTLGEDGYFRCDLNGVKVIVDYDDAAGFATCVLALRDEIRAVIG